MKVNEDKERRWFTTELKFVKGKLCKVVIYHNICHIHSKPPTWWEKLLHYITH